MGAERKRTWRWLVLAPLLPCAGVCGGALPCLPAWLQYGVELAECPDGDPVGALWVSAEGLRRGHPGTVVVGVRATTAHDDGGLRTSTSKRGELRLELRSADGKLRPLDPIGADGEAGEWVDWGDSRAATITLPPELTDGVYTLIAHHDGPFGALSTELALPLYAPAHVHLLSDRPLYEPGQTVLARAVALRRADLVPLADRPGSFVLKDPQGNMLLREAAALDALGVAAVSLPLDAEAESGTYTLCWSSGEDEGCTPLQVEPFTLPRFTVEAETDRPWHLPGDPMGATLRVRYASGAPVPDAAVAVRWTVDGGWPPPSDWMRGALPTTLRAGRDGLVRLSLPPVPADLVGAATLVGALTATDPTGEAVAGTLRLALHQEPFVVDALTEIGGGVAEGVPNRVWVRARLPDGRPLSGAALSIKRAWEPGGAPTVVTADEDGFALVQLDPGPAVSVRVPGMPVRATPLPPPLQIGRILQLGAEAARLDDQRAIGEAMAALGACASHATQEVHIDARLKVRADGGIDALDVRDASPTMQSCLQAAAARLRLPSGDPRVLEAQLTFNDPGLPVLEATQQGGWSKRPADFEDDIIAPAMLQARACFSPGRPAGTVDANLIWSASPGSTAIRWERAPLNAGSAWTAAEQACVVRQLEAQHLWEPADEAHFGVLVVRGSSRSNTATDQPGTATLRPGYELQVTAQHQGAALGAATLRLWPAPVPDRRVRVSDPTPAPGATVEVELLRGPNNPVQLPDRLWMNHQDGSSIEALREGESRTFRFTLPADKRGWYTVQWAEASARVWVSDRKDMQLRLEPSAATSRPGGELTLRVQTTRGEQPVAAHVSLVGVDESLGQLAPLPGPDALGRLRAAPTTSQALPGLELAALTNGAVRGEQAIMAMVATLDAPPPLEALDRGVSARTSAEYDPTPDTQRLFFDLLRRLHAEVRAWEAAAPADEKLRPATVARLWGAALDACEAEAPPCADPFGRRMRLGLLPQELLALTDPRLLVRGDRLPEDMEHWPTWVAEEDPR
ncbi:MAG: hypothetical protein JNM72_22735 [Deltaproteobacteria bacterium]|nr:hypothetical protein [Deltaproteobacteria bacterium]